MNYDKLYRKEEMSYTNDIFGVILEKVPNNFPIKNNGIQTLVHFFIEDDESFYYKFTIDIHWVRNLLNLAKDILTHEKIK